MRRAYYKNELKHHGILGQKWGRRRFQYDDGSLTPEGRIRYGVNSGGYTISKGSEFNRITGLKRDKKTLFVSTNEKDFLGYRANAKNLPSTMKSDKAYIKTYTAKKDLKVASGSDVANYIIEKYGNTKTVDGETIKDGINYVKNWTDKVASDKNFNSILTDKEYNLKVSHDKFVKDLVKHFGKLKYDTIVDPEDYTRVESGTYIFDEPLIILNKNKSIVETGRKYVNLDDVASVSIKDVFNAKNKNTVEMKYKVL